MQYIRAQGMITLADYMQRCAKHYYATRNPFGKTGDFITAPEISQMFGELIGIWVAQQWSRHPVPSNLVELGAGRGTLMQDLLRAAATLEGFVAAQRVIFVEHSLALRKQQKQAVPSAHFIERLEELPRQPLYLIANEFFDALPIRQFEMTRQGWRERCIAYQHGQLVWQFGERAKLDLPHAVLGTIAEICPQAETLIAQIATHIQQYGGAAIIIDYGSERDYLGDSLQAVRQHDYHPVLEKAGEADLSAHVRFARLREIATRHHLYVPPLLTQKEFLEGLGIQARAEKLIAHASQEDQQEIRASLHRLTAPEAMGSLFKTMILLPPKTP